MFLSWGPDFLNTLQKSVDFPSLIMCKAAQSGSNHK